MVSYTKKGFVCLCLVTTLLVPAGTSVWAQDNGNVASDPGYKVGESKRADKSKLKPRNLRQARFEDLQGNVTWRTDERGDWQKARRKQHLEDGAQIWVTGIGHAELRFGDGSLLRIGNGAVVTLQTIAQPGPTSPDALTRIKMSSGVLTALPSPEASTFQIDTLFLAVKAAARSRVRVGVTDIVEVGVSQGAATVEGKQGKTILHAGNFLALQSKDAPYDLHRLPRPDDWERWNEMRDHHLY